MAPQKEILYWQRRFRNLRGWKITLDENWDSLRSQIHLNESKTATIGRGPKDCALPENYILHEVLHIAIKAASNSREDEEFLVQDLTEIVKERDNLCAENAELSYPDKFNKAMAYHWK